MNNLTQRIITGSLFGAVLIFCILWNEFSTGILFLIFSVIGTKELFGLLDIKRKNRNALWAGVSVIGVFYLLVFSVYVGWLAYNLLLIIVPILVTAIITELFTTKDNSFRYIQLSLFAVLYVLLPFVCLNILSLTPSFAEKLSIENERMILLGFFIILWTSDSMAYATGKLLGKNKIAPAISPGKTWEGVIGGLLFSMVAAYLISYFTQSSLEIWLGMGFIISIFGFLGDLSESIMKRKAGIKDSGTLLPGHGGVLDRFDGIVLSAPLVVCYLAWI